LILYDGYNQTGESCRVSENSLFSLDNFGCQNRFGDKIFSISISYGKCVDFWRDENFSREKIIFCLNQLNQKSLQINFQDKPVDKLQNFNNDFSSLRIYNLEDKLNKIFFYVDTKGEGYSSFLQVGESLADARNKNFLSVGNDNISSFNLPKGSLLNCFKI